VKAVDLLVAVSGAGGEVKMYAVRDRLGIGDRHEAHAGGAFSSVPVTISFSRPDRTFQPSGCVQNRASQSGKIVSVEHDVVESDGQAGSMRGTLDRIPETRWLAADGSITGGHAPGWRPDRVINLIPRQLANPAS
jgi:hypothetical protein